MKTTRRDFLKGLLTVAGTVILTPQALIEPAHGASDLAPGERDVIANALGLRSKQWAGWGSPSEYFESSTYIVVDDGPKCLLEHFVFTTPERRVGLHRASQAGGSLSVGMESSTLLSGVFNQIGQCGAPTARARVVVGGNVVFDDSIRITSYSLGGGSVTVDFVQDRPVSERRSEPLRYVLIDDGLRYSPASFSPSDSSDVICVVPGTTIVGVDSLARPSLEFSDDDLGAWRTGQPVEITVRGTGWSQGNTSSLLTFQDKM